jgi:predicted DNA-binding transcriptional regulator AlpA
MAEYEKTRWLDRAGAAAYLSMQVEHLKRHVKSGKLPAPSFHLGPRSPRWDREALDAAFSGDRGRAPGFVTAEKIVQDMLAGRFSGRAKASRRRELAPPNYTDERPEPERVRPADVARMSGVSTRKVQEMAAAGRLPGAARIDQLWTFDPAKIRAWILEQEALVSRRHGSAAAPAPAPAWRRGYSAADLERAMFGDSKRRPK